MKKYLIIFLLAFLALPCSLALAQEPEIIWLNNPSEEYTITHYNYDLFNNLRYQPAEYGEGLYSISCLKGNLYYTAHSPEGSGDFYQGYVNQSGKWVLSPVYHATHAFSNGLALINQTVIKQQNGAIYESSKDFIINRAGQPVNAIQSLTQHGYTICDSKDSFILLSIRKDLSKPAYFSLIDLDGNIILPPVFENIHLPSEGFCLVKTNTGYGFYQTNGTLAISPLYQNGKDFSDGLAAVQKNGKWGYINQTGNEIIAFYYENAYSFTEGLAAVQLNEKWGFIDKSGKMVIEPVYDEVKSFSEGVASVRKGNLWGCINQQGNQILPCQYQAVEICSDNRIAVKLWNRYGYFDSSGEKIIDFLYGAATDFHEGFAVVSSGDFTGSNWDSYWHIGMTPTVYNNNLFGVIDRWGNPVLPEEYLCISDFEDGTAICQRADNKKVGIIQAPEISETDSDKRNFVRLYLNNQLLCSNQSPVIQNNRTLVPLRTIAEALNASVDWNQNTQTVTIQSSNKTISIPINSHKVLVDNKEIIIDAPAQLINNTTMVPLRFISEQLNAHVFWDNTNYSIWLIS